MDIQEILKEWGFEELAQEFTENGINMEVLKICSIEDISSLLSPLNLGSKIIFKRKLEEFQKGAVWVEVCSEVPVNVESAIIPSCSREYSPHTASTSELFDETPIAIRSGPTASFPNVTCNYSPIRILKDKSGVTETPKKKFRKSLSYDELCYEVLNKNLKENVFGRSIISFYEKTGYLDRSNRNKLAKLIISLELDGNLDKSITSERFLQLREAIVKIFPTETKETWYTPYQNVGNDRKINAKGKLLDLYHNNRKNLIKSGIIARRGRARNFSTQNLETVDESVTEKLAWLSKTGIPFEKASLYWKETVEVRNKHFQENNLKIYEYMENYPLLKKNTGSKLLLIDFEELYAENSQNLFNEWPSLKEKIILFAREKVKQDSTFRSLTQENNINLDEKDEDLSTVYAILIVGIILSHCKPIKGTKSQKWRPTKQDAKDGLLLVLKSSTDFKNTIDLKKTEFSKHGIPMQPTPIVVLEGIPVRCSSYIYINGIYYTCESPIIALDLCFKTFHVLNATYPLHAKISWHFLQLFVYKIKTKYDEHFASAKNLAEVLKIN